MPHLGHTSSSDAVLDLAFLLACLIYHVAKRLQQADEVAITAPNKADRLIMTRAVSQRCTSHEMPYIFDLYCLLLPLA